LPELAAVAALIYITRTSPRAESVVEAVYRVATYVVDKVRIGVHRLRDRRVPE
jgi:hypothetical protein